MYRETNDWRARIGRIIPGVVDGVFEMQRFLPEGVEPVLLSLFPPIQKVSKEHLERAFGLIEATAKMLADEESDYIIIGGAPIIAWAGPGSETELMERVRKATGLPVTSTLNADMWAFNKFGAKKIALASPMSKEVEGRFQKVLEAAGYEVVVAKSLGLVKNVDIAKLGKRISYQLGKEVLQQAPEADCLYLPCGRWPVIDNIAPLERDFGKPVVASTLSRWAQALTELSINERVPGFGRLMDTIWN